MYKNIIILGSTGSIGRQTLDVCRKLGVNVVGLSAHKNIALLRDQIREFSPEIVCISDEKTASVSKKTLESDFPGIKVLTGLDGLPELASLDKDALILNAVVGIAGLGATLAAANSGNDIALANKESLVTGGKLVIDAVRENNVRLLPVDSEHSAIFQCLQDRGSAPSLSKIILTASGGPFCGYNYEQLEKVTKARALRHPNWTMGAKVTIDSATLMNKGLEFIEAAWLFGVRREQIEIVVHRLSIIHSAVQFSDNSIIAQMATPDMRIPIQYAVTYPERYPSPAKELDLFSLKPLTFEMPDEDTFICLAAAKKAFRMGGLYPCAVNGANERAVELFLDERIGFTDIGKAVRGVLSRMVLPDEFELRDVYSVDKKAREYVDSLFGI